MPNKKFYFTSNILQANEERLRFLVSLYQQKVFAFVLYLSGCNRDQAYDLTASSFAEVFSVYSDLWENETFLGKVLKIAVLKCRSIGVIPSLNNSDFETFKTQEKESLQRVQIALQKLPFNSKVLILLRDQLNLSYKMISGILKISDRHAKAQTAYSRLLLRRKLELVLDNRA